MMSLFDDNLKRLELLKLHNNSEKSIKIMIHRNHSFEIISSVLNSFLGYFCIKAHFEYSSYDDSLTFPDNMDADLHILWLDLERYNKNSVKSFVEDKIDELYSLTKKNLIVGLVGDLSGIETKTANVVDINDIIKDLGEEAFDLGKEKYSGTRLSNKACIKIAQYLGLKFIPSYFMPQIKAVVTDLDNTFYEGILGEDGIKNLVPYKQYQQKLKDLSQKGYMICIASKNDDDEVCSLFEQRKDFFLGIDDFTCRRINWGSKADNIIDMAKQMNIGLDSILFIDDNIAEIESVSSAVPQIKTILFVNEKNVLNKLNLYPGFLKTCITKEDLLRSQDIKANEQRNILAKTLSKEEYFEKLGIKLTFSINDKEHIKRIAELFNKTNQFILSYKRYSEVDVVDIMNGDNSLIVSTSMSDNLSDSGIIALLSAHMEEGVLFVDELTVSCRALGRNLENVALPYIFKLAKDYLNTSDDVKINYKKGERNKPALDWVQQLTNQKINQEGVLDYMIPDNIDVSGLMIEVYDDKSKI